MTLELQEFLYFLLMTWSLCTTAKKYGTDVAAKVQ